jgi:hypothetical protein
MADFGAPVAQNVNVNAGGGLDMLSKLLNAKQAQQNLQTGAIQQQGLQAEVQQQQQTAKQRSAQASFFQDWDPTQHVGDDGTLDLNSAFADPKLRKAAGDQFPDIAQKLIQVKQGQLTAKGQLAQLNGAVLDQFGKVVGGLREDPDVRADNAAGRGKVGTAMAEFGSMGGPDAQRIASIYGGGLMHAPPGKLWNGVNALQLQAMDAATQAGKQVQGYVSNGAELLPNNPQAAGGTQAPPIPLRIPPGAVYQTDANGRVFQVNPQNPGAPTLIGGGGAPPAPGGRSAAPSSGFVQPVSGQQEAVQDINNARGAATTLQIARNANAHLLSLSQDTLTGPVSAWSGKAAAALGLPQGSGLQEIDAYLQRSAMAQAQALPHTNAGLESAQKMMGTTSYTPQALQEKVKFADALNSGALAYTKGLNAAVGTGPNPDLSHYNAFRTAWAQNFDPDVYRWEDAQRRGDKAEQQAIRTRLGPKGIQALAQKSHNLAQLEQGVIPGG